MPVFRRLCLWICLSAIAWAPCRLWAQHSQQKACAGEAVAFPTQISAQLGQIVRWSWHFDDPSSGADNQSQLRQPSHVFAQPGTYRVSLTIETKRGISDTIFTMVDVLPPPQVSIHLPDSCPRDTLTLEVESDRPLAKVRWQLAGEWLPDSQSMLRYAPVGRANLDFVIYVRDSLGCKAKTHRRVPWPLTPPPPQVQGDTVCFGEQAHLKAQAPPGTSLQWLTRDARDSLIFLSVGGEWTTPPLSFSRTYYARAIDSSSQCPGPRAATLALVLQAEAGRLVHRVLNPEHLPAQVAFRAMMPIQPLHYQWDFGDGSSSQQAAPDHTYPQPGRYEVSTTLTYQHGCEITLRTPIYLKAPPAIALPSAFSPNGDGFNDTFAMEHVAMQSFHLRIFDRRGQLVFETRDPDFRWDGKTLYGSMVREGIYICLIEGKDLAGKPLKQKENLTIIR